MFKLFSSDPVKKLEKQLAAKLEAARDAQRAGNMPLFATLTDESDTIAKKIDALKAS